MKSLLLNIVAAFIVFKIAQFMPDYIRNTVLYLGGAIAATVIPAVTQQPKNNHKF